MLKYLSAALLITTVTCSALAQQVNTLNCQGSFMGVQAAVQGTRQYSPYNALGDGYVSFSGVLLTEAANAQMVYEGYTNLGGFEGVLQSPLGVMAISVLDATGSAGERMILYQGGAFLGAPPIIGEFVCYWS